MPSITEEERRLPDSPEDRPISGEGCCELCLYNIPRGSMMVILPGIILLLCGGLTLLVTNTSSGSGSWTSVTSLSILIVGAIITVGGFLFCTKMWCKYKPKKKKSLENGKNNPVSLVAVYKIRQDGHDNPGFVPDSHGHGVKSDQGHKGRRGVVNKQPSRDKKDISEEYVDQTLDSTDGLGNSASIDLDKDLEKGDPSLQKETQSSCLLSAPPSDNGGLPEVTQSVDNSGNESSVTDQSAAASPQQETPEVLETSFSEDEIIFRGERIVSPQTDTSEVL